ncbi:hypothetical protein [Streptomyces naphthomycinicus]|uniref:hypothetical protein n=1 Tax=Streptomyces naphthomycinicus TaxID=2872625 RepID=UPI001CED582A|nr:hypothetical protein [Streptomyces sp. TML10]
MTDRVIPGPASDQMAWGEVYELALRVAEEHGATIPQVARDVGRYDFTNRVHRSTDEITLSWKGKVAP